MLPLIPCQLTSPVRPHSQATSGPCSGGEQNCSPLDSYGVFGLYHWLLCPGFVVCFKVHHSHSHSSTSCGCWGHSAFPCFQYARFTHALPASVLCPSWCKCLKYKPCWNKYKTRYRAMRAICGSTSESAWLYLVGSICKQYFQFLFTTYIRTVFYYWIWCSNFWVGKLRKIFWK